MSPAQAGAYPFQATSVLSRCLHGRELFRSLAVAREIAGRARLARSTAQTSSK
jgi:hypothetical protein